MHVLQQSDALVNLLFRPEQHHRAACIVAATDPCQWSETRKLIYFNFKISALQRHCLCTHTEREASKKLNDPETLLFQTAYPFFFTVVLNFYLSLRTPGQCGEPEDSVQIFSV